MTDTWLGRGAGGEWGVGDQGGGEIRCVVCVCIYDRRGFFFLKKKKNNNRN